MEKKDLPPLVVEALRELGGRGTVAAVCRVIWRRHEPELRASGDLFYTWQYDVRWAAQRLRNEGTLRRIHKGLREWELA